MTMFRLVGDDATPGQRPAAAPTGLEMCLHCKVIQIYLGQGVMTHPSIHFVP